MKIRFLIPLLLVLALGLTSCGAETIQIGRAHV